MANVLINSQGMDPTMTQQALGYTNKSLLDLTQTTGFVFPEPKSGIISTLWPSEATWHPLYKHDKKELATYFFGIQDKTGASVEEKRALIDKTKNIVIESYPRAAMSSVYIALLILVIIIILQIIFGIAINTFFGLLYVVLSIVIIGNLLYAQFWATGVGENYWTTFMADISARVSAGQTPAKILEEYTIEEQKEADRNAMLSAANMSSRRSSGFGSSLVGSFVGSSLSKVF